MNTDYKVSSDTKFDLERLTLFSFFDRCEKKNFVKREREKFCEVSAAIILLKNILSILNQKNFTFSSVIITLSDIQVSQIGGEETSFSASF